ncbi:hypothetical protein LCGC14_2555100, partial [marine sediment metagenome]
MSWDADTTELRIRNLEKELQNFREIVESQTGGEAVNLGGDISAGSVTGARALGPIQYPFVFNPVNHRRFDTEPPPGGGGDVFNTIFVRSTAIIVTPKAAEDPMQIRTLEDPIHDGQIMLIAPTNLNTLDLLSPTAEGNINIVSDITGITDDQIIFLQWQENSPIGTSSSGSWIVIASGSAGGGSACPPICTENDLG